MWLRRVEAGAAQPPATQSVCERSRRGVWPLAGGRIEGVEDWRMLGFSTRPLTCT